VNLGAALQADGRLEEAARAWRRAVELDERSVGAYCNLASVYLTLDRASDAWTAVRRAVALAPDAFEVRMREGDVLMELGQPEDAAICYAHALRLAPRSARGEVALGYALDVTGRIDEAMEHYDMALAIDPSYSPAHVSRASVLLLKQAYERGWDEYEWRMRAPENAPVHDRFKLPVWDGAEPLAGRTILYYAEQGLGDEIMYASCVPELIGKAGRCVIECDVRLATLFQRSFPHAIVHGGTQTEPGGWLEALGPVHFKISAATLPGRLRRSVSDFPQHSGYLRADASRVQAHRGRLGAFATGPKIGVCWRGGVLKTGRAWRSLHPKSILQLLGVPGATFVSLQRDASAEELGFLRDQHGVAIEHWQDALDDVEEAAALVGALDLTISVCTWIVHLAGAQGLPVWVMAPVRPEPRYGLAGSSMRWYPTARVFRQRAFGVWNDVVDEVAAELRAFIPGRR
jgi:Flp pilus assembly protein TadD